MMTTHTIPEPSTANATKAVQLEVALSEILAETTRRGFYGVAGIEIRVQDGTIYQIRRRIERVEK